MTAVSALVLSLLQQVTALSHAEPPIFQVETLLQVATHLPLPDYSAQRREFLVNAIRANAAVRDPESHATFHVAAAHLLAKQDATDAARLCQELTGPAAIRCWAPFDIMQAVRSLSYTPEHRADASQILASGDEAQAKALLEKWRKLEQRPVPKKTPKPGPSPAIKQKMDRADETGVSDAERSNLLREVLDISSSIEDITERMLHEGLITAWFAENREEGTAALAAAKLHKTFAEACACEDAQCDSIAGRAECSDHIDSFAELLAERKIDPAVLRISHPSLAARFLVTKLKEALQ